MITLTRITGVEFTLNPDLIERVDRTPDTVVTLVDGTKYLVKESLDEVTTAVVEYRARILARAGVVERSGEVPSRRTRLSAVPTDAEAPDEESAPDPVVPLTPRCQ